MERIIFIYEGMQIPIVCNKNEFFRDIVKRFKTQIQTNKNNLYFLKDARDVPDDITYEMLCNPFDRQDKTMKVLVLEKEINMNENKNKNFSFAQNNQKRNFNRNNNYNINSVISKMQSEINQLKEKLGIFKFLKEDIQGIRFELIDLKKNAYNANALNE